MGKLRIFLTDDHAILRQGLKLLINGQEDMQVIGEASNGKTALRLIPTLQPDVAVMDVSMPEMNGLEATQQLKKTLPQIKVLALTRHNDSSYLQPLLQAGIAGYVLKQSDAKELLRAIRAIAVGGTYLDPAIAGKIIKTVVGRNSNPGLTKAGTLSERETEVLRLIAQGYSNKEIAAQFDLSVKTIEAHKANAMLKLGLGSRVEIVRYALLQGWLQTE